MNILWHILGRYLPNFGYLSCSIWIGYKPVVYRISRFAIPLYFQNLFVLNKEVHAQLRIIRDRYKNVMFLRRDVAIGHYTTVTDNLSPSHYITDNLSSSLGYSLYMYYITSWKYQQSTSFVESKLLIVSNLFFCLNYHICY